MLTIKTDDTELKYLAYQAMEKQTSIDLFGRDFVVREMNTDLVTCNTEIKCFEVHTPIIPAPPLPPATRYVQDNRPPPPAARQVQEDRRPSMRPGDRMPLAYFIAVVVLIVMGLIWSFSARAADLDFDPKAAQQEQVFKLLTWQTINCMSSGAMNQVSMGERDADKLADWLVSTCASQLARYSIEEMKIEPKRVLRLMRAMATTEIANVPGVTLKKP